MLECVSAWESNGTADCFLAFAWQGADSEPLLVAVNYAPHPGQCRVRLPLLDWAGQIVRLKDITGSAEYIRDGDELASVGLYLDLPAWGYHVLALARTLKVRAL